MKITKLIIATSLTASTLFAHGLWVNAFDSTSQKGGHVTVSLGWGHHLSIDDSIPNKMVFDSFDLISPDGNTVRLQKPSNEAEKIFKDDNIVITQSNTAMQKVSFNEASKIGTYSVSAVTKANHFTRYVDKAGKIRFARVPEIMVNDAQKILESKEIRMFAKTYFSFNEWTQPKALGHKIEIIPTVNFSTLKIGEIVTFDVLYDGKPLENGYITAKSEKTPQANALYAKVKKGKVKFVLPVNGKWLFETIHEEDGDVIFVNKATVTLEVK
jgi:uncharacterized GH25 family protein